MGLDTSHDCWRGAYSAFSRWRNTIAEVAGYKLTRSTDPNDFGGEYAAVLDDPHFLLENYQGRWPQGYPEDPLLILLAHSDCDGVIEAKAAPWLADRLEGLLPKLAELPPATGHIGDWVAKTQKFIDGLRAAAEADEDVDFH